MTLLSRLDTKFGRYAVPNLTVILIAGQVVAFLASFVERQGGPFRVVDQLSLVPALVLTGEVWRLVTFLFIPPTDNLIFALFFWSAFFVCGTVLERVWGSFRFNLYLLIGYAATIAVAFAFPIAPASNYFLKTTVFLAFARLNPDFSFNIYGLLPVRAKWLALLIWLFFAHTLWTGPWPLRLIAIASIANYLLFFGRGIWRDMKHSYRRVQFKSRVQYGNALMRRQRMAHACRVCGLSSEASPKTQFRYCSECGDDYCYCPEHLRDHEHVTAAG